MEKRIPFKNNCHNCHIVTLERIDLSKKRGNNELRWRQACFTSVASLQNGTDDIKKRLFWGSKMTKNAFFRYFSSFLARVSAVRFFAVTLLWEGTGGPMVPLMAESGREEWCGG